MGQEGFPGAPSQPTTIPKLSRTKVHPADPPLNSLGENTPARHALYGIHIRHWIQHDHSRGIQIYTSKLEFETKPTNQIRLLHIPPHFRCHGLWKHQAVAIIVELPDGARQSEDQPPAHGVHCPQRSSEHLV